MLSLMLTFSSFGAIINDDQEENFLYLGEDSFVASIGGDTLTSPSDSVAYNLVLTSKPIFISSISQTNNTENLTITYIDNGAPVVETYAIPNDENYYISIEPSHVDDQLYIQLSNPNIS